MYINTIIRDTISLQGKLTSRPAASLRYIADDSIHLQTDIIYLADVSCRYSCEYSTDYT